MAILARGGVAVVAGGAGQAAGLGAALVRGFVARGMRVAILDMDGAAASALADELSASGADALACEVDVCDVSSLARAVAAVESRFGACNVLCAHVGGGGQGPFDELTLADWRRACEIMVVGTVATVQAFLPLMRSTSGPRQLALTSSVAALAPGRFQGPYRAAKAAVTSIGETLALELAPERIGVTIAFPSGMVPVELLELARAAGAQSSDDGFDLHMAIAREMAPDPADVTTGSVAAAAVLDAIDLGHPYVVTHGVTAGHLSRARHRAIEAALEAAIERPVS